MPIDKLPDYVDLRNWFAHRIFNTQILQIHTYCGSSLQRPGNVVCRCRGNVCNRTDCIDIDVEFGRVLNSYSLLYSWVHDRFAQQGRVWGHNTCVNSIRCASYEHLEELHAASIKSPSIEFAEGTAAAETDQGITLWAARPLEVNCTWVFIASGQVSYLVIEVVESVHVPCEK